MQKNNPFINNTGVLWYSDNKFIQLVEGELKGLYDKIKEDIRLKNCVMISYAPIKERSFPN